MRDVTAPVVAPGLDAQALELGVDLARGAEALGLAPLLAAAEQQLALVVERDVGVVGRHVGKERARRVVVERGVHPVAEVAAGVVGAGETDAALEEVRAAQREDRGVSGAQVKAKGQRTSVGAAHLGDERDDLLADRLVVRLLARGALDGVAVGAPGLAVDVADAEELDHAGVEVVGELVDEPDLLEALRALPERGERHDGLTGGTIHDDIEVLPEDLAVTNDHLLVHSYSPVSTDYQKQSRILALMGDVCVFRA